MTYEDLLQELIKMTPEERKQNVVISREYGGEFYYPVRLNSYTSFSTDRGLDWEILVY